MPLKLEYQEQLCFPTLARNFPCRNSDIHLWSVIFKNAIKCNLTEWTTMTTSIPIVVSIVLICACTRIPCTPRLRCVGSLHSDSVYSERCFSREHVFKHPPSLPSLFPLLMQCGRCLSPLPYGLVARFPGFVSHGSGLHLGAGCQ